MDVRARTASASLIPPRNALRIEGARGELAYWELAPNLYATKVSGVMSHEMARVIIDQGEGLYLDEHSVCGVHDWFGMTNYETVCRLELTAWVLRHRARSILHIGVASRMVAMGVSVANLALGNLIQVHARKDTLSAALAHAFRTP